MENEYINQSIDRKKEFDLFRLVQPLRQHWKKVLLIWIIIVSITFVFVINKKPEFVSSGTLYISDTRGSGGTSNQLGTISDLLPEMGSSSDIESHKELLKGTDLVKNVISKLGLNAEIEGDPEYLVKRPVFWQWRLPHSNPPSYNQGLKVTQSYTEPDLFKPIEYHILFNDSRTFILIGQGDLTSSFRLGEPVRTKKGSFLLTYDGQKEIIKGSEFKIKINPPGLVVKSVLSAVSVKGGGKVSQKNNLIHVSYGSGSPYTSQAFVDTLFQEFIAQSQTWATSVSRATLEFVETQEKEMRDELEKSSSVLSQFQKKSGIVSLEPQVQADLKRLVDYEVQLRNQQLKLFELKKLVESLNSGEPDQYLLTFAENPLIQNMGVKLTELSAQIASLQSQFQPGYPPLMQLRAEQKALLGELRSTLQNDLNMARINEEQMAKTVKEYKGKFEDLPEGSQFLTEYLRSTKVYEELFLFLLQEKQKAKIAEASTLSNIRIVDQADLPLRESSPKVPLIMMLAGIIGLFIACWAVIIPGLRKHWYGSVNEIKAHFPQPVLALLPPRPCPRQLPDRATPAILEQQPQSRYLESIRLLRTNLFHVMAGKKHQTIMVTSAMPGDGKTSIIANLGMSMIKSERVESVLLIDADMHNPSLHGVFGLPRSPGLADYLTGQAALEDIIHPVMIADGKQIDIIFAGPFPSAPIELIDTQAMQVLLNYAKCRYTFTLIDSTPYPMVTSAAILAGKVDRVLVAVRLNHTDSEVLSRHINELSLINSNIGLIIANSEQGSYDYGYGFGNDYSHGERNGGNGKDWNEKRENILQRIKVKSGPHHKN